MKIPLYSDELNNELKFYVNDKNKLFIEISQGNDISQCNFITLGRIELLDVIKELQNVVGRLSE